MRRLLFLIFLLIPVALFAQDYGKVEFFGRVSDVGSGQKMAGVTVEILQDGKPFQTRVTTSSGKFEVKAPLNHKYTIKFKKDGYVMKYVEIGATGLSEEDASRGDLPMQVDMTLFKDHEKVDFSVLNNKPIGKANFDPRTGDMSWDMAYTKTIVKQVDKLLEKKAELEEEELRKQEEQQEAFEDFVKEGDKSMKDEEYIAAVAAYESALKIKPGEPDVQNKLDEAKILAKEQEEQMKIDKQYKDLMTKANASFDAKKFEDAKKSYQEASELKPQEDDPKDRIKEIDEILAEMAASQAKYDEFMKKGEDAMSGEKWDEAIEAFEGALDVRNDDPTARQKLEEAEKKKEEAEKAAEAEAEKREKYEELVADADKEFDGEAWEESKKLYEDALKLYPDEQHPKDRISAIDQKLEEIAEAEAAEKAKEEEYNSLMAAAKSKFDAESWEDAKAKYQEASNVFPDKQEPKDKIAEIDQILKELAEKEEAEKEKRAEYDALIADADSRFDGEQWEDAKSLYEDALEMFPDEQHPKDRISAIEKKLEELEEAKAEEQAKQQKYEALIAEADDLFDDESWDDAKSKYEEALEVLPDEQHPKDRISAIDKKLEEIAEAKAARQKEYDDLIAAADGLFDQEKWEESKAKYEQASEVFPDEDYPQDRIEAIEKKLEEIANAEEAEAEKRENYNELITEADGQFKGEEWEDAKATYKEALELYSDEQHPKDQIAAIDKKLEELAEQQAQEQAEQEKQQKYDDLIASADDLFDSEDYEGSKEKYKEAYEVIPEDYPQQRIDEINEILKEQTQKQEVAKQIEKILKVADEKFDEGDYEGAKTLYERVQKLNPDNERAEERIEEINDLLAEQKAREQEYNDLIAKADGQFNGSQWEDAKETYNEALEIKPNEQHPKDQIAAIDKKLEELAAQEQAEQAEAEKRAKYDELIKEGDAAMKSSSWEEAEAAYKSALNLFDEQYPKAQLEKLQAKKSAAQKDEEYNELIALADDQFDAENYEAAKESYKSAYEVKATDYPQKRINEINELLKKQTQQQEVEKQYQKIIDVADEKLSNGQFSDAKTLYERASKLKPSDPYPKNKMREIDSMLAEMAANESKYTQLIKKADGEFDGKMYERALDSYKAALNLFDRQHPKDRIAEIEGLLAEKNAEAEKLQKYDQLIAQADREFKAEEYETAKEIYKEAYGLFPKDYPQSQVDRINEILKGLNRKENAAKQYQKIIDAADKEFANKDYESARDLYKRAISLKPEDKYPSDQIRKIDQLLADLANQEKNAAKEQKYKGLIAEADAAFNSKDWNTAKAKYREAYGVLPKPYPQEQIDKINEMMQANANAEREKMYQKIIAQADQDFGDENYKSAKGYYKRANSLKPSDPYPKRKLKEIAAILNAEKGDLNEEGLGDMVNDQSVIEGMALLKEAEKNKYGRQLDEVGESEDSFIERNKELTEDNSEWRYEAREFFDEAEEEMRVEKIENDEMRQENVENLKEADKERNEFIGELDDDFNDNRFENREKVLEIEEYVSELNLEYDEGRIENAEDLKERQEDHNETVAEMGEESDDSRFENREIILESEEEMAEANKERDGDRIENAEDLKERQEDHNEAVSEMGEESDDSRFENREIILESEEEMAEANKERDGDRIENAEDLKDRQEDHNEAVAEMGEESDDSRFENREIILDSEEQMAEANKERDGDRIENAEDLKDRQEDHNEAVAEMGEESDDSRFENREVILESQEQMAEANKERDGNRVENSEMLKEQEELHNEASSGRSEEQKDRAYANEDAIDELLHTEPEPFTPAVKDALATKYKEGVTTLTYNTKNEHGDVTRVIVRKIVVDGNVGNDYRMVMTLYGRTYTKNGRPIAEHQWKMETSGPSAN